MKYPDLSNAKILSIDTETKDPELLKKGNGVFRNDGYLCGVAISDGVFSEYYNLGHPGIRQEEKENNEKYIKDVLKLKISKLGTNFLYDLDWLINWAGWEINGQWHDIIIAESLINEYRKSYSLEHLANIYLGEHKKNEKLYGWCKENGYKVGLPGTERKWIYKMPYELVREYAIGDVDLPIKIFEKQTKEIQKEHLVKQNGEWKPITLEEIYDLEVRVQPMLLYMRKNGVRLDKERLAFTGIQCQDMIYDLDNELKSDLGRSINVNSTKDMQLLFKKHNIPLVRNTPTEKMQEKGIKEGNPTFAKAVLSGLEERHPIVKKVLDYRHFSTIMSFFVKPYPELLVGDRLHCNFYPTKRDEGGTVTGRFSSTNPNLQQVSGKKEDNENEFMRGKIIRKCFIPEEGYWWMKNDWSQIEYRLIAHYAIGPGAVEIRKRYNEDPNTDYHVETGKMSGLYTDIEDEDQRRTTKTLNFGTAYGMGAPKMARTYGWDLEYAYMVYNQYHRNLPFVRETSRAVAKAAEERGYIKTILGRHCHVPESRKMYVMFNRLIQGSAADIMKKAMVESYEAGIYGTDTLIPHLTVHDELDCSVSPDKNGIDAARELKNIMENCVKLRIPIKCDSEMGYNWGELRPFEEFVEGKI